MPNKELKDVINKWVEWLEVHRNYSSNTISGYVSDLYKFLEYLDNDNISLNDLKYLNLRAFRGYFSQRSKKAVKRTTIARQEASLRCFFKWLDNKNIITNLSIYQLSSPKLPKSLPNSVGSSEIMDLIAAAKEDGSEYWIGLRDCAIFILLYGCGLRISEALSLKVNDIDAADMLKINGKGDKNRYVPILPIIKESIKEYIKECPYKLKVDEYLFLGAKGGQLQSRIIQRKLQRLRLKLNLSENITPHSFRHSFATHLLAEGSDLRSIQELLGHSSLSSTQRYTDVDLVKIKKEYKKAFPN